MGVTFYICDPAQTPGLDALVEEMEAEDPLEEVEDSAYDRFAAELEAHHLASIALSEEASAPAEAFYEWFHDRVSQDLDKLYLTATEAKRALGALEKQSARKGGGELSSDFWAPGDDFSLEAAGQYLEQVREALRQAIQLNGLMVICYR